jgi:hypothetical protein
MTISSVKTGTIGDSLLAGNAAFIPTSYESIASYTATGGETSISFTAIASTYAHLQLRMVGQRNTTNVGFFGVRLNNVTTTGNYTQHSLSGNGSTVTAAGLTASSYPEARGPQIPANTTANTFGVAICDIHDYASTSKNKTIRWFGGWDNNGSGDLGLFSNVFLSTSAVNRVDVYFAGDAVSAGSVFSLYGIKGA